VETRQHRLLTWPLGRPRLAKLAFDTVLVVAAWWLAFWLRFDRGVPAPYHRLYTDALPLVVFAELSVFVLCGFYSRWWRYTSLRDMWALARGVTAAALAASLLVYLARPVHGFTLPRSVAVLNWLLLLGLACGARLVSRSLRERPPGHGNGHLKRTSAKTVVVVGAGDAAQLVVRELERSSHSRYRPLGYVDDDPRKRGARLQGLKVLGTIDDLPRVLEETRPDELLVAIPSAPGELRRRVVAAARDSATPVKTLPSLHELLAGDLDLARQIRPVEVEDLLGRDPVEVDLDLVSSYLEGAVVVVTGAGGSIGAELCRQIARYVPLRLVLVEQTERALFEIERELRHERMFRSLVPVLADCCDLERMRSLFIQERPTVVFHAAAYKHVPLLEENPLAAVRNNVLATRRVAIAAAEAGVGRFVLVSTDKAANPKSLMGRSKAVCEWIIESYAGRVETRFVAVRFGNVLGSSGSVIPIFRRQLERGEPLTVTHPEMTRYFMTIPEAVALIVEAGALGVGGEVFVLDMGDPVRIVDLAENVIRLSGRDPDEVPVIFTGIRPGEKLHEELWGPGEDVVRTSQAKILRSTRAPIDPDWLEQELDELERLAEDRSGDGPQGLRLKLETLADVRVPLGDHSEHAD
jgi:FlaA1/EpsC-like NDP-sugar epimerase